QSKSWRTTSHAASVARARLLAGWFGRRVSIHPHARADQVAVAIDIVDAADGRPELVPPSRWGRKSGLFPRIRPVPFMGEDGSGGGGRFFEDFVLLIGSPRLNGLDFGVDGNHGIAESVQLFFGFTLGRFDHHGARDWPGDGGCVKS